MQGSTDIQDGAHADTWELGDSFLREVVLDEPPPWIPEPGERLGGREGRRFLIQERLGGGAMGEVFRARDEKLQRVVALKFLLPRKGLEEGALSEARAIARLNHENIVHIFDVSEWSGAPGAPRTPFIVMECLQGESLAAVLRRGRLEVPHALDILDGIAAGLAHAHEHLLIHRDLKPSNIFLTRGGTVKLLDFGLSHLLGTSTAHALHLPSAGTPGYMAPEQWRGEPQDARTDIWAAGVVFYEMLTGMLPLPCARLAELRERVLSAEPIPLVRARNPDVPPEVEALVATLLAKDPARRFPSASELREEVRDLKRRLLPGRDALHACVAERRQVTLVSCQLAGITGLSASLDGEDVGELELAFHQSCAELLEQHGGSATLYMAGEVLGCFGCPQVREDDSERAVRAGLHLLRGVREALQHRLPHLSLSGLAVRVGLHTDLLSLCEHTPDSRGGRMTLQGEAPKVVSWLARQAGPGEVVLGDTTWRLVRGAFEMEALGPRAFEGMAGPASLEVHRVLRERETRFRFERALAAGGLSPMVGREHELQLLLERWERARSGEGAFVLVRGEAGIGKSRLLQELGERMASESVTPLRFQCWSRFSTTTLHPVIEVLQHVLHLSPEGSPEQHLEELERYMGSLGLSGTHVQLVALLLALPVPESAAVRRLTPERRQEKTVEVLVEMVLHMARERPVLTLVEDLHWADSSQLRFLELLLERVHEARMLVVLSTRPEFHPVWPRHPWFHVVTLERLPAALAEDLVEEVSRGRELPVETVRELVRRTDGIPLFIEEMTRMVLEGGRAASIPVTLHELLLARLDMLPSRQKALVQLCAVVGRDFSPGLLGAISGRDEATLRRALAGLVEAGLLQEQPGAGTPAYQFRHALILEAAYQSLSRGTRRQHHRHIARVLEERFPELVEGRPELLAHHYTEAGELELAIQAWELAGERASRRSNNQEAINHFRQALKLLPGLPDEALRARKELHLLMDLGTPMSQVWRYNSPELERLYERVRELLRGVGEELPRLRLPFWGFTTYYLIRARFELVVELIQRYLELERREHLEGPSPKGLGLRMALCRCLTVMGDYPWARRLIEEVLAAPELDLEQRRALAVRNWIDAKVSALSHASLLSTVDCQLDESRRSEQEAAELAGKIGQPYAIALVLCMRALATQLRHEGRDTLRWAEECVALCREHRFKLWLAWAAALRSWALAAVGQPEAGLAQMRMVLRQWQGSGIRVYMPHCLGMLAEIHLMLGQPEEGLNALRSALRRIGVTGERFYEAELHRLRGECLRMLGKEGEARYCFLHARATARRQEARLFELRATVSLCRQLRDLGRSGAAGRILARMCARLDPHLDSPDLRAARTLLEELAHRSLEPSEHRENPPGLA